MNFWTPRNCSVVTIQGLLTGNKPQASVRCSTNRFTPAGKQDQSLMSLVSSKCCNEMIPQKKNTPGTPFCRMSLWMSAREIMWVSTKRGWEGAKTLQGSWHSQGCRFWFNNWFGQMNLDQSRLASPTHHLPFLCSIGWMKDWFPQHPHFIPWHH